MLLLWLSMLPLCAAQMTRISMRHQCSKKIFPIPADLEINICTIKFNCMLNLVQPKFDYWSYALHPVWHDFWPDRVYVVYNSSRHDLVNSHLPWGFTIYAAGRREMRAPFYQTDEFSIVVNSTAITLVITIPEQCVNRTMGYFELYPVLKESGTRIPPAAWILIAVCIIFVCFGAVLFVKRKKVTEYHRLRQEKLLVRRRQSLENKSRAIFQRMKIRYHQKLEDATKVENKEAEKKKQIAQQRIEEFRNEAEVLNSDSQLSQDTNVVVIAVSDVECSEKICFISVLLSCLEYRSVIRGSTDAASKDGYFAFLSGRGAVNLQSLVSRPGLHIWPQLFQLADNVAVVLMCVVGAFPSDLEVGGVSAILSASVLCSSVQLVHVGPGVGTERFKDCLHKIMTSTDFLFNSKTSSAAQLFPRLLIMISEKDQMCAGDTVSSNNESMFKRTRTAIRNKQIDLFLEHAAPFFKYDHLSTGGKVATVSDLQVNAFPNSYLSSVFELCDSVLGREDAMSPLKFTVDGRDVTLGEFSEFVSQSCAMVERSELIPEWSRRAVHMWVEIFCEEQVTDGKHFDERERQAGMSAFSTHERLREMWEFNDVHPDEWNRLCCQFYKMKKLWNSFDVSVKSNNTQQHATHIENMLQGLAVMRDFTVQVQNVLCQWHQKDWLIRGECGTYVRKSVSTVLDKIAQGEIASTRQYIETRNSLLDVSRLLNTCMQSLSTDIHLLLQYRDLVLRTVGLMSERGIYVTDTVWITKGEDLFKQIHSCTQEARHQFDTEFSSMIPNIAVGHWNDSDLDRQLRSLTDRVIGNCNKEIAKASGKAKSNALDEFDLIFHDQTSNLHDYIEFWIITIRTFRKACLTWTCLDPQRSSMSALDRAVQCYLLASDLLEWCVRSIPG